MPVFRTLGLWSEGEGNEDDLTLTFTGVDEVPEEGEGERLSTLHPDQNCDEVGAVLLV